MLGKELAQPGRRCDALTCDGEFQGIALSVVVSMANGLHLPPAAAADLVYLDYIEVAPWNLRTPVEPVPRFSYVGARLVQHLVLVSTAAGFDGRVGLHSLPQSEATYAGWGMTRLGHDPDYDDLIYFEFAAAAAAAFAARDCR
jgi:hypothetical protein